MTTYTQNLPGVPGAARAAREFTAETLAGCPARDDAVLVVSELVTNAIQHSRSAGPAGLIRLRLEAEPGEPVQIDVQDDGPAPVAAAAADGEHGRGLLLIAALADACTTDGCGLHSARLAWNPAKERAAQMSNPSVTPALSIPGSEALPGPELPTLDDLTAATAATTAAIARHEFGREDIAPAAELERATLIAYLHRPEAEAVLEAGA